MATNLTSGKRFPSDFTLPLTKQFRGLSAKASLLSPTKDWMRTWLMGWLLLAGGLAPARAQGFEDADLGDLIGANFGNGLEEIKDTDYPIPATGAYFVAPNGSDAQGNGTLENPWKTIIKAIGTTGAPAGATIVLRAGTYRSNRIALRRNYTLQPYRNEKVWIKGSIVVEGWEAAGNLWRKTGWNYNFKIQNPDPRSIDPGSPTAVYRDMVYLDGKSQKQVLSLAQVVPGKFFVDTLNQVLYLGDNPQGKLVESTVYEIGIDLLVTATVRGLGIAHYAESAVGVFAPQCLVENNTLVWNGKTGAVAKGKGIDASRLSLRGNTFSYNGELGFAAGLANDLLLEGNRFSYNNIELFRRNYAAAAVKIIESKRPVCRNNLVFNNNCMGIWLDLSIVDAVVVNNYVGGNQAIGIFFEVSKGIVIAGNYCVRNGTGIGISGSSSALIYNNTLVNNNTNLSVKDTDRRNTNATEVNAGIDWETREVVIKNNIFSGATPTQEPFAMVDFDQTPCNDEEVMVSGLDYNAYYRSATASPVNLIRYAPVAGDDCGSNQTKDRGKKFTTLSSFRAQYPNYEANALVSDGNETVNPFLVNETGDFRLRVGSPAIGRGEPLPATIADQLGWPAGLAVNMGASPYVFTGKAEVVYAIDAGSGSPATAGDGTTYQADIYSSGGTSLVRMATIAGTTDNVLYQSERYGNFSYNLPISNGTYQVVFKFAELNFSAPGQRIFDVLAEGVEVITNLDIYAQVGHDVAYDVIRTVTVTDGQLNLQFRSDANNAQVGALKIVTSSPGAVTPLANGTYTLTPECAPNLRLDAWGGVAADGTDVRTWTDNGLSPQRWLIEQQTGGSYRLSSAINPNYVLDVANSGTTNQTNVWLYTWNNSAAQKWTITEVGNGYHKLVPLSSPGLALAVEGGSSTPADVWLYGENGLSAQRWRFTAVGSGSVRQQEEASQVGQAEVGLAAFPNPAVDQLTVSYRAAVSEKVEIALLDMLGRRYYSQPVVSKVGPNQATLRVGHLKAGFYLVRVTAGGQTAVTKVLLTR